MVGFLPAIAMVCWQQSIRSRQRAGWLLGLFGALVCADLTHTYAVLLVVPFALAELVRSNFLKRIDWALMLAVGASGLAPLISLPQFRVMKHTFPASIRGNMMAASFVSLLAPAVGVLAAALVLYCIFKFAAHPIAPDSPRPARSLDLAEIVALLGIAALPIFTMALSKVGNGPYYVRYCLTTVAGFWVSVRRGGGSGARRSVWEYCCAWC